MTDAAPFTALRDVLALEQLDDNTFVGQNLPQLNGRVYGGQVLAQAILAAGVAPDASQAVVRTYDGSSK